MSEFSDEKILESWHQNAKAWINSIEHHEIESRILVTNKAIVDCILDKKPLNVLDIGCGEGWLSRELNNFGIQTLGIDAVPELIDEATKKGKGNFKLLPYEGISNANIHEKFDVAVCNFSLIGNESVKKIFKNLPELLTKNGYFIIQTIHPILGCGDSAYQDGWRKGSWKGFSDSFTNPAPWYFRTLDTWINLFVTNGFIINSIIEPINPKTKSIASILFVGKLKTAKELK
jgi:2-polyprenyl-3-methyl-5-hydroxy-6-metoxy-1,4-benzoquinol methylase